MGKTRPPYPAEFREEAVKLVRAGRRPASQIARELGVSIESLRLWVKQSRTGEGDREGLTDEERAELSRLWREVVTLRQEREILRKAAAFFARESESR